MQVRIIDRNALLAVTPAALSAYARTAGWNRHKSYRVHSDVYVGNDLPEIIVPKTERLGDYSNVVADLIKTFAHVDHQDETGVYRSLITADRDVIRLRTGESQDGSIALSEGAELISGARDILLAVACTLDGQYKSVYRTGANRNAINLVDRTRLGQTDQGSFVVTLLTPVIPSPIPTLFPDESEQNLPIERCLTVRLMEALNATRFALERTMSGDGKAFPESVDSSGVSANLCEALAKITGNFSTLDVSVSWAQTQPMAKPQRNVAFGQIDTPLLREASRSLRENAPKYDVQLQGNVRLFRRDKDQLDGAIRLNTIVDQKHRSVTALLERHDYERAVQAHRDREVVILSGDLERMGQRWRLLNPRLIDAIDMDDDFDE